MTGPTSDHATASPREVVQRLHRLVLDYDISGQAELYAPDGVLEWPFAPPGVPRRLQGRDEIRRVLAGVEQRVRQAGTRLTELRPLAVHETLDPEVIVVELQVHGEVVATGATYELPYIQVLRVRDGEILSFRDYWAAASGEALKAALGP